MTTTSLVEKKYIHICIFWLSIVFLNKAGSPIISIFLVNYLHLVHSSVFGTMSGTVNVITSLPPKGIPARLRMSSHSAIATTSALERKRSMAVLTADSNEPRNQQAGPFSETSFDLSLFGKF